MAVLIDERGSVLSESYFLNAPDENTVGSKVCDRLRLAKQAGLGVYELRQAARQGPIAPLKPCSAIKLTGERL